MRYKKRPDKGDIREVHAFLLFSKSIGNETRWLEFTTWCERYERVVQGYRWDGIGYSDVFAMKWVPLEWK